MQNGDILLVNRQPTLHKPSIMAHKAKILPKEKTFRLDYSNCACYNDDFDGDEINIHFLQEQISRGEGYNISNTSNQYIVPIDGKPIRGLLQESIDSNVKIYKNLFKNYSQKNLNKVEENDSHNNSHNQAEKPRKKHESVISKEPTSDSMQTQQSKTHQTKKHQKLPKTGPKKAQHTLLLQIVSQ